MAILLAVGFAGLGARLVVLQVVDHCKYRDIAERKRVFLREPRRGKILDANGTPLATSVPVKKLFANPRFIGPYYREVATVLAPLLEMNQQELEVRIKPVVTRIDDQGVPVTNGWANLERKVSIEQWQQITQALGRLTFGIDETKLRASQKRFYTTLRRHAVYAEDDQERLYASGSLAAHVIGYVQEKEEQFNDLIVTQLRGQYGIERRFENFLQGTRGWRISETDPRRREIVIYREQEVEPRPGMNVVLTLDSVIQGMVEAELAQAMKKYGAKAISSVVMRPSTGEILALAVLPNFDPNKGVQTKEDYGTLRNRVVADTYEPGSTFKIIAMAAALDQRKVRLTDYINCENGLWSYKSRPLRDHGQYKNLTAKEVIGKSSNIGMAKVGLMLGEQTLYNYITNFGFGRRTEVPLDGEVNAYFPPPKDWDGLKITRIPMGQGVAVTHMQMVCAMSAVANGGRLMRPMLVKRVEAPNGETFVRYEPQTNRQVISERAARDLVSALKTVVSTNGTARQASLDLYTVGGKTGTAEKAENGRYVDKYVSSFIGFFPADNPEVCISVVIDEPDPAKGYYGGQTAAPLFKLIAEHVAKYLKIKPDIQDPDLKTAFAR